MPVAAGAPLRWAYFEVTKAASENGARGWSDSEEERGACAAELKARGLAPKAITAEELRDALKSGAR